MLCKFHTAFVLCLTSMCCYQHKSLAQDNSWQRYCQAGAHAYEQAGYGQAERMFKLALKEAEKFGPNDVRLAHSLANLGVLYNFRAQFAKAGPLFEQAIKIKQNALGPESPDVVASVMRLCQFHLERGNFVKADPIIGQILAYTEKVLRDRESVKISFNSLSVFYKAHPELENAEVLVKQAEKVTYTQTANHDLELASLLDSLGDSCKGLGRRLQTGRLYQHSLLLRERSLSGNHIAVAQSLEKLAKLCISEEKYSQAEPFYKRALAIARKTLGQGHPQTFSKLDGLGQCLINQGKLTEARSLYENARDIYEKSAGGESRIVASCLYTLGNLFLKEGRYREATPLLGQALQLSERINGPEHISLSPILDTYAEVLERTKHHAEAVKLQARAKAIRG